MANATTNNNERPLRNRGYLQRNDTSIQGVSAPGNSLEAYVYELEDKTISVDGEDKAVLTLKCSGHYDARNNIEYVLGADVFSVNKETNAKTDSVFFEASAWGKVRDKILSKEVAQKLKNDPKEKGFVGRIYGTFEKRSYTNAQGETYVAVQVKNIVKFEFVKKEEAQPEEHKLTYQDGYLVRGDSSKAGRSAKNNSLVGHIYDIVEGTSSTTGKQFATVKCWGFYNNEENGIDYVLGNDVYAIDSQTGKVSKKIFWEATAWDEQRNIVLNKLRLGKGFDARIYGMFEKNEYTNAQGEKRNTVRVRGINKVDVVKWPSNWQKGESSASTSTTSSAASAQTPSASIDIPTQETIPMDTSVMEGVQTLQEDTTFAPIQSEPIAPIPVNEPFAGGEVTFDEFGTAVKYSEDGKPLPPF
jgi:single-stranded DNA-binding protein